MKKKARAYHHGDLEQAVRREALALVREQGLAGLTLREVARRLGVSHAAPYRHFADRAAVITALAAEGGLELARRIEHALAEAGTKARRRFLAGGYAYVRFALDEPAYYATMFSTEVDKTNPAMIAARAQSFGTLLRFIAEAQAAKAIVGGDAEALALPIWAMHHGLATLAAAGAFAESGRSAAALRAIVDDAHGHLWDGLSTKRGRK